MVVSKLGENAAKAMFVELLVEGRTPSTPVTPDNVKTWVTSLEVPFTTAYDSDPPSFEIKDAYGIKETTYIVERTTMKIVAKASTPDSALPKLAALP